MLCDGGRVLRSIQFAVNTFELARDPVYSSSSGRRLLGSSKCNEYTYVLIVSNLALPKSLEREHSLHVVVQFLVQLLPRKRAEAPVAPVAAVVLVLAVNFSNQSFKQTMLQRLEDKMTKVKVQSEICHNIWGLYRVTIQIVSQVVLTSKQRLHFRIRSIYKKNNLCFDVNTP